IKGILLSLPRYIKIILMELIYFFNGMFIRNLEFAKAFYKDPECFPARFFGGQCYTGSSVFITAGMFASFETNTYYPARGFQYMADVLIEEMLKNNGEIHYNEKAVKILIKENRAVGVKTEKGEYFAENVVSNVDLHSTINNLTGRENYPGEILESLDNSVVSDAVFNVYLGLDLPVKELMKYLKNDHIYIYPKDFTPIVDNDIDNNDHFLKSMLVLTTKDREPNPAPENHSILMISSLVPPGWMNNWHSGDSRIKKEKYYELKDKITEILIKRTEKIIPGLSKHIIVKDAGSPVTFEDYTDNRGGATVGFTWDPFKGFLPRNKLGAMFLKHPVKNLYQVGSWTQRIGGYGSSAVSGKKIGQLI
ncbi:MAG: NAD(P)/FAD-dependent oxidoreductase, partial [Actinomycetia bacterium]|nr:NAD(P)/FAD-dependent oxidoreductase [Actinomycetes bacterium]